MALGIARSFQIPQLFTSLNALENVEIALGVAKQPLSEASAILERFGLSAFAQAITLENAAQRSLGSG